MKRKLITLLVLICLMALLLPLTVSAEAPQNGWVNTENGWTYYKNGALVKEQVLKIGDVYYGFDYEGIMYDDSFFYCDGYWHRAKPGGALYVNQWMQDGEDWYYFGAEGKAPDDFTKMGSVWYFFENGWMKSDCLVWSNAFKNFYALNKSGTDSKALTKKGWHQAFGNWYYLYEDEGDLFTYQGFVATIGGAKYYFKDSGKMAANEIVHYYDYINEQDITVCATAGGPLLQNGWAKIDGKWYYAQDYELAYGDVYEIGGKLYYFKYNCEMYDTPGKMEIYPGLVYVNADGTLKRNEWYLDTTRAGVKPAWTYYGADGCRVHDQFFVVDGKTYYFDESGAKITNSVIEYDGDVLVFDDKGEFTAKTGWFQHPVSKNWMYAKNGRLYGDEIAEIGGVTYAFDDQNCMVANDVHYDYDSGEYYAYDANGHRITTKGWKKLDGSWVYVTESGCLHYGWLKDAAGNLYWLEPNMIVNTTFYHDEDNLWYAFGDNGVGVPLSGTGFRSIGQFRVYIKNGVPVSDDWIYHNGAWYYTWYDGEPYSYGSRRINGKHYLFDGDGKLHYGWLTFSRYGEENTYCSDSNGVVYTGWQTIGGKKYYFFDDGLLNTSEFLTVDDVNYWFGSDHAVRTTLKDRWNQIGSKWYYFDTEDQRLLKNELAEIGGFTYGFGSDYAMCSGGICYAWWDYYMFDAEGHLLTGWQQIDGKWSYADPNDGDPRIYWEGVRTINDVEYLFKNGYLQGGTYYEYGGFYTASAEGVVTGWTSYPDGWTYYNGSLFNKKNGELVTGWVGDYYVSDGDVQINNIIEYDGKYYYLGTDGRYLKSGWLNTPYGTYIYAKPGGALACNEWLQIGSSWYYFDDVDRAAGYVMVDNEIHRFADDGKWLGKTNLLNQPASTKDGWKQIDGFWFYYNAGRPLTGLRNIGGTWYYFEDESGIMISNACYEGFYFDASGARVSAVGWKQINGQWLYFNANHRVAEGLQTIGGKTYYFGYYSNKISAPVMATNRGVVLNNRGNRGALYIFNASGVSTGVVTGNGWKQAGSEWYYLINNHAVVDTEIRIGNSLYYFNYDGVMVTNEVHYSSHLNKQVFYGSSGAAVTKTGWHQVNGKWIYVQADGSVCSNGVYKIGGQVYSFLFGFLV